MKTCITAMAMFLSFSVFGQSSSDKPNQHNMMTQIAVWDTYVTKKDGTVMHFDILVPASQKDTAVIYQYGRDYLKSKGQAGQALTAKECRFCHVTRMRPQWEEQLRRNGYFILELENCQ